MPRWLLVPVLLLPASQAQASWPEDIDLYSMLDQDGLPVLDREILGESYRQLVMELGSTIANKPITPAETLGFYGFAADIGTRFVLTEARDRKGLPSPWTRAHVDENSAPYHMIPTMTFRKGLPLSSEIGATFGWIGGTATGIFGGYARAAVLEGYKPWPDVSLQVGYSGYVGNDQLDAGALDFGVTVGSTFPVGMLPGVNAAQISPYANFTTLRVSANATIDEEVENDIGALRYSKGGDQDEERGPPFAIPQVAIGSQFTSGSCHFRLSASWAPATIPTVDTGFGFTF